MFPDGAREGLYHTADATLWFFHAVHRYLQRDRRYADTCARCCPVLVDIVPHHLRGTRFGIGVDPADGLLRQGADGYQLTWMDAKVDDWVVTPRRGQGGRDQRALVQRAVPARRLDDGSMAAAKGSISPRTCGPRPRVVQPALLVRGGRLSVRRRRRRAWRRFGVPAESGVRHLARSSGARTPGAGQAVMDVVREPAADAGGPAVAGTRAIRTTRPGTTATCGRVTPPTIRAPYGDG